MGVLTQGAEPPGSLYKLSNEAGLAYLSELELDGQHKLKGFFHDWRIDLVIQDSHPSGEISDRYQPRTDSHARPGGNRVYVTRYEANNE
jgi:hypothetical protein